MFGRLAILQRGEPAMRLLNAVAELRADGWPKLRTIALFTEPDRHARFVRAADEGVCLGAATVLQRLQGDPGDSGDAVASEADYARLEAALVEAQADAAWIGGGFLAEPAAFAELCARLGIVFVGPDADVIRRLGDGLALQQLASEVGIPVVPGGGPADDAPLVPAGRHVEVQVIADRYGNVWAPGVRDCSIRHDQKTMLEESAGAALTTAQTDALRQAAIRLCRAAGYVSACTVEFRYGTGDAEARLLGVNAQVEHPVTEMTTGLDLVKLQLHVAAGGHLDGEPPPVTGHAVQVNLTAEDPEHGFLSTPGRVSHLRLPAGPGVRVDAGVHQDDEIPPQRDPVIARLAGWGRDRPEALSRLARALEQTRVVVEGGATNKSFLLSLVNHPDVRVGRAGTGWLDEAMASGDFTSPEYRAEALLIAAVEVAGAKNALMRARFFAAATRGRPELPAHTGQTVQFRFGGRSYQMRVLRTAQDDYQVHVAGLRIALRMEQTGEYERQVTVGGRRLNVHTVVQGPVQIVEVEGVAHRIVRDDGGIVRAPAPGVVVSLPVKPGDEVAVGDTVAVLEMMKMETPIPATIAGRVRAVPAVLNVQVDTRARLVELEAQPLDEAAQEGDPVDFTELAAAPQAADPASGENAEADAARTFAELRAYVLGYERDPSDVAALLARQRQAYEQLPAGLDLLRDAGNDLLEAFASLCVLSRRALDPSPGAVDLVRSPEQYLFTYLRSPARGAESLPDAYLARLRRVLRLFGVDGLAPSPDLDVALVLMFRATHRLSAAVPFVAAILDRRLADRQWLSGSADPDAQRALLDRLVEVAEGRYRTVADLAREVRFRWFDQPALDAARTSVYAAASDELQHLQDDPDDTGRAARIARIVACPQPLRQLLLDWYRRGDRSSREVVLEVAVRRYYRTRHLNELAWTETDGHQWCSTEYEEADGPVHLVLAYTASAELGPLLRAVDTHLRDVPAQLRPVVDVHVWHTEPLPTAADADRLIRDRLTELAGSLRRPPHQLSVTVSDAGKDAAHTRTYHFTYLTTDGQLEEDRRYPNLHPMLAERLDLWRLSNFELERLPSVEDVYLFRGVARTNPKDERLFALAEVRDVTPVVDAEGRVTAVPLMERMYLEALSAMRRYQSHRPAAKRLLQNHVILHVRPPWTVPSSVWEDLARRWAVAFRGLEQGLWAVVARVQIPAAGGTLHPRELHVTSPGAGVVIRESEPDLLPVPVLSEYEWRALQTRRRGSHYPYDIVRMLTPPRSSLSVFPPGDFVEYDLVADGDGALGDESKLEPVDREYGGNATNIVVGVIRNSTPEYPDGMTRVVLLGDPSRGMGNLAEGECRRIMAACDLAQDMRVPLEWFAVSAGAKISMSSGVENMDWISAVLRRLIEITQAGVEVNVVVTGINVGAQPYWNAEATMLMHTKGILVMIPESAMVLTGKTALDFSGGVSAEDNLGIGGYERVMGPNGQAQYYAPDLESACKLLYRHYSHAYVQPGERFPRRAATSDPVDRDIRTFPHARIPGVSFTTVGEIFSRATNAERKKPFDIRSVMRAVTDADSEPLERWTRMRNAENVVVWDAHVGGIPVCLLGIESRPMHREGTFPADGPGVWTAGTLFPQASRKTARAVNSASGNRPLVVMANLSGFDGSPESMRNCQLEYGAEIGRAVTNFRGPIVFVVVSRYHGGAFVVFSKKLNPSVEVAAIEGSYSSVIGGAPAAAVVFTREVDKRTRANERVAALARAVASAEPAEVKSLRAELSAVTAEVRGEELGQVANEYEHIHTIERAREMGSVDRIISPADVRPYVIEALERGMARQIERDEQTPVPAVERAAGLILGR